MVQHDGQPKLFLRLKQTAHLLDNPKAVSIIALQNVGAHESEDGHDVVHELIGDERTELGEKEESLVVGLRVLRGCFGEGSARACSPDERKGEEAYTSSNPTPGSCGSNLP